MKRRWIEIDWTHEFPRKDEIKRSRKHLRYEPIELTGPGIDALLAEFRRSYGDELVAMASFRACDDDWVVRWFAGRNRLDEYGFFPHFLGSSTVRSAISMISGRLPSDLGIMWPLGGAFALDGELAAALWSGGQGACGQKFDGTPVDAKRLGAAFTADIIGDRYEEFLVYRTHAAWSDFFSGLSDNTWILVDKATAQISLLCLTVID